jgi:hypothetical protein
VRTISHRELRNNSAEVLREVRAGATIEVIREAPDDGHSRGGIRCGETSKCEHVAANATGSTARA